MTYRDEAQALKQRVESLKSQLSELKGSPVDPVTFEAQTARLEHEIAQLEAQQRSQPFRAPLVDRLKVATPCDRSWHEMSGDEKVRFCGDCRKSVYNLSAMTASEIEGFVAATGGNACIRLFRRTDGTVLTQDCDVALDRARLTRNKRAQVVAAVVVGAAVTAAAAMVYESYSTPRCHMEQHTTGVAADPGTVNGL